MSILVKSYSRKDRLRSYSSIFSRRVFTDIINYDDFTLVNTVAQRYDLKKLESRITYLDYMIYAYKWLMKDYRCEYVYKNTIINELLIKKHGTDKTIAFNEFRVRNSIVDFALFNGVSKAFEIKTEYDSDKRLDSQISDYSKLFQECYLVVPEELEMKYRETVDDFVGIDVLYYDRGKLKIRLAREAKRNTIVDVDVLIRSLRTQEYKNIVRKKFGQLPAVSCFDMFERCKERLSEIPSCELQQLFIDEIKQRKHNTESLRRYQTELRQLCLSLNINDILYESLQYKLCNQIKL